MAPATYLFAPAAHAHLTPYLAALHASCITHDGTMATFLPPLNHEKLLAWWKERMAEGGRGDRLIVLMLDESEPGARARGAELVGVVMLAMPYSETGPFRGFVEKLFVSPRFRRRGAASALLRALETEALLRGRTLLMVDAETESPAEQFYRKMGFVEMGTIPKYGVSPTGGEKRDETFFYKDLTVVGDEP